MLRMFQPSSTEFWQLETSKLETPELDLTGTVPVRFFKRTSASSAPLRLCVKNSLAGDCPRAFSSLRDRRISRALLGAGEVFAPVVLDDMRSAASNIYALKDDVPSVPHEGMPFLVAPAAMQNRRAAAPSCARACSYGRIR